MRFKIKKNQHYCSGFLKKFFNIINTKNRLSYIINFDESALYDDKTDDKYDINKLCGFSDFYHHKNSFRFGWNSLNGVINLYAYTYVSGKRKTEHICSIKTNQDYKLVINVRNSQCVYTVISTDMKLIQTIVQTPVVNVIGYTLWPYFGGNKTAPHDMAINLNLIE